MLLVGRQEGHPAYKISVVGCWCGYQSGARCRFAYGPADATVTHYLSLSLAPVNTDCFTFLLPANPGSPGQNPESHKMAVVH